MKYFFLSGIEWLRKSKEIERDRLRRTLPKYRKRSQDPFNNILRSIHVQTLQIQRRN